MLINDIDLPEPIFHAMIANVYTSGDADYTASSIVYGAKEYWGRKLYGKETNSNCSGMWAAFTGVCMHLGLEKLLKDFNQMILEDNPILKSYIIPDGYYILEDRQTIQFNENRPHRANLQPTSVDIQPHSVDFRRRSGTQQHTVAFLGTSDGHLKKVRWSN
jgi:hypothetical protein